MNWLLLVVSSVFFVESLLRLGTLRKGGVMLGVIHRAWRVVASPRISDHWKERALPLYSRLLFRSSFSVCSTLAAAVAPIVLLGFFSASFADLLTTFEGLAVSCLAAASYVKARAYFARG